MDCRLRLLVDEIPDVIRFRQKVLSPGGPLANEIEHVLENRQEFVLHRTERPEQIVIQHLPMIHLVVPCTAGKRQVVQRVGAMFQRPALDRRPFDAASFASTSTSIAPSYKRTSDSQPVK